MSLSEPSWQALKSSLVTQAGRLTRETDARLIGFSGALLGLDGFFIAVFSVHKIYAALYNDSIPMLGDKWHIGRDGSFAEMFGYLKTAIIVSLLISIPRKWQRPIYLALILIFIVALLDDALQLHERLGHGIADALTLKSFSGRMSPHFGELILWMILGVFLLAGAWAGFVRSPQEDRSNGLLLMGGFAVLVLFAVVADFVHVLVKYYSKFRGGDFLFTVIEEGGEQMTLSLICSLAVLIHREVRSRESR